MLSDNPESYRGLIYPWGRRVNPEPGVPEKIAEGVYWVRFPMPIALDHINIWLLEDDDGWTVVDTCLDLPQARETWESLFTGFMQGKPVTIRLLDAEETHATPELAISLPPFGVARIDRAVD